MAAAEPDRRELRRFALADLRAYDRNARKHSRRQLEALRASLRRFGFGAPVVVWRDGMLLAGHGRVEAAQAEGLTDVPGIDVSDLPLEEARAYCLADNRISDMAGWDEDALAAEMTDLAAAGIDLAGLGFSAKEIGRIAADMPAPPSIGDAPASVRPSPDPAPAAIDALVGPPVAQVGEVWAFGDHRLVVGSCTDATVIARVCEPGAVDLLLCDPPYGVDYGAKNRAMNKALGSESNTSDIASDALGLEDLEAFLTGAFSAAFPSLREGAAAYAFSAPGVLQLPVVRAMAAAGLPSLANIVWVKNQIVLSRADINYRHEALHYAWKPGAPLAWHGPAGEDSVWECDKPRSSKAHPTMKPVALLERAVRNSSAPGDLVLDIFAGSGSTLEAAHNQGRRAALVELEPKFADVILRRAIAHLGLAPVREDGAGFEEVAAARRAAEAEDDTAAA